jgi:hypothetical protein
VFPRLVSAIGTFFKSLFGKTGVDQKSSGGIADVDQVATDFYTNLVNAERKQKREQ